MTWLIALVSGFLDLQIFPILYSSSVTLVNPSFLSCVNDSVNWASETTYVDVRSMLVQTM